jgi:quercetin dioxygenase-like cupin family protein
MEILYNSINDVMWRTHMKIINFTQATCHAFDNEMVKGVTGRVVIGKDDGAKNFCMRVFTVAAGGFTPKHSHAWEHEVFVHAGQGRMFRDGEWVDVKNGSVLFIPGGEEHQFKNTGSDDFIFVCLIPSGIPEI